MDAGHWTGHLRVSESIYSLVSHAENNLTWADRLKCWTFQIFGAEFFFAGGTLGKE